MSAFVQWALRAVTYTAVFSLLAFSGTSMAAWPNFARGPVRHVEKSRTTSLPFLGDKVPGANRLTLAMNRRGPVDFLGHSDHDFGPANEKSQNAKAVQRELLGILRQIQTSLQGGRSSNVKRTPSGDLERKLHKLHPNHMMSSRCRFIPWRPKQVLDDIQRMLVPKPGHSSACATRDIRRALYLVLTRTRDRDLRNRALLLWLAFDLAPPNKREIGFVPKLGALYGRRTPSPHPSKTRKESYFSIGVFDSLLWLWITWREREFDADFMSPGIVLAWRSKGIEANMSVQFALNTIFSQLGVRFYSFRNRRFRISHSVGIGLIAGPWFTDPEDDEGVVIVPWATGSPVEIWVRFYKGLWFHVTPVRIHPFYVGAALLMSDFGLRWEF